MLRSTEDAFRLLEKLGASDWLILHHRLVVEAVEELLRLLNQYDLQIDTDLVCLGAAIHDSGKIEAPSEMHEAGSSHEPLGYALLIREGVSEKIARCCLSHARYESMDVSLEELLVAVSDKLWKGKRVHALESRIVDEIATQLDRQRWDVFSELDNYFEKVADRSNERLARSRGPS